MLGLILGGLIGFVAGFVFGIEVVGFILSDENKNEK